MAAMEPATISIPTLNEEDVLPRCLDSIQDAVEYCDAEIEVLILDSSDDRTPEIARSRSVVDRVVEEDLSILEARHRAFELASHDIVVAADADSVYDKAWLQELLKPVNDGALLSYGACYGTEPLNFLALHTILLQRISPIAGVDWVSGSNRAVRKDVYFEVGGYDVTAEKYDYWSVLAEEQFRFPRRVKQHGDVVFARDAVSWQDKRIEKELLGWEEKQSGHQWDYLSTDRLVGAKSLFPLP